MSARVIDYYFSGASPFALLGHRAFREVARRHGAAVRFRPVSIAGIWAESGAVMPAQRPPVRQRYRLIELQRLRERRGVPLNLKPKHHPIDIALADRCTIAIVEDMGRAGEAAPGPAGDPVWNSVWDWTEALGRGVWVDEADMSDEAEIARRLEASGHDAAAVIARARSEEVEAIRQANTRDAVAADAVGVPAYVLDGEVFWGQDRIDELDAMLSSGRAAYGADAA